jgi:23S rRNA pseudouridine2604 synthase
MEEQVSTRLNKFISDTGYCSRREADKLIEQQRVTINGVIPVLGTKVYPHDVVSIDGKPLLSKKPRIYIAFNKPYGIDCTTDRKVEDNIIDYIHHEERIFPIGRLDKPSEGLIFLTNDGDIVNKILRAGNNHEKEYLVTVDRMVTPEFVEAMSNGLPILGVKTKKCVVKKNGKYTFTVILTQGLNRQIRRMCEYLGYRVEKLKRTRIMNIKIDGIQVGTWRYLSEDEMQVINDLVANSSKTEEASVLYDDEE